MDNPLHADFDYSAAYPVPVVTVEEFERFTSTMHTFFNEERADAFASLILWARCGIPTRLVKMGLDDESAMVFSHVMLEYFVQSVTGLALQQIADAVPDQLGLNAYPLLLSTDFLNRICRAFEFISENITMLSYEAQTTCARVQVLDELAQVTGLALERDTTANPYVSPQVYEAVKARWARE